MPRLLPNKQHRWRRLTPLQIALLLYLIGMILFVGYANHALGIHKIALHSSPILASSDPGVFEAVDPALRRLGVHLVHLKSKGSHGSRDAGGAVMVYTTDLLQNLPPGLEVVYVLPSPATYVAETLVERNFKPADSGQAVECALLKWAAHYHHWRLLTRHWNHTLTVPMEQLCNSQGASRLLQFLGVRDVPLSTLGLCSKQALAQLTSSATSKAWQLIGGDAALQQVVKRAEILLDTNSTHDVFTNQSACGARSLSSSFTAPDAPFKEYSSAPFQSVGIITAKSKRSINLLTTYFPSSVAKRKQEVDQALQANFNNPYVDQLHVFIDGRTTAADVPIDAQYIGSRVKVVHMADQPTYAELAEYANQHLSGQVAIMHNVDCVFTDTVQLFHMMGPTDVYGLSRQQSKHATFSNCEDDSVEYRNQCYRYGGSHDAFSFIPPIASDVIEALRYKQNAWFADQKTIAIFEYYNYTVSNPCYDIILLHHHCSDIRGASQPTSLPERPYGYGFMPPTHVNQTHHTWTFNLQDWTFHEL